jgi:hypothetical protein
MARYADVSRQMTPGGKENFKEQCYFFYGEPNPPTVQEIKDRLKCVKDKKGRRHLYARYDDHYRNVSVEQMREGTCISRYNMYFKPGESDGANLTEDALYESCDSESGFKDVNKDFDNLMQYANELATAANVDKTVHSFVSDLILYTNVNVDGLNELYNGAYTIIRDNGFFYNKFFKENGVCNISGLVPESSHDSLKKFPQYRFGNGALYSCTDGRCDTKKANSMFDLLVGKSPNPHFYGDTWFQFEYANIKSVKNKLFHVASYFKHKATGQNVGPLGISKYLEYSRPLILSVCCSGSGGDSAACSPVPCVGPDVNLHEESSAFLRSLLISMPEYERLKKFTHMHVGKRQITFGDFANITVKYFTDCETFGSGVFKPLQSVCEIPEMRMVLSYIVELSKIDHRAYDNIEMVENVFLIFDYANRRTDVPVSDAAGEILQTIKKRQSMSDYRELCKVASPRAGGKGNIKRTRKGRVQRKRRGFGNKKNTIKVNNIKCKTRKRELNGRTP